MVGSRLKGCCTRFPAGKAPALNDTPIARRNTQHTLRQSFCVDLLP